MEKIFTHFTDPQGTVMNQKGENKGSVVCICVGDCGEQEKNSLCKDVSHNGKKIKKVSVP